jgi:hypothetical protein
MSRYSDNTEILRRKAEGRLDLAKLSFAEKIERVEAMRERTRALARRRDSKKAETPLSPRR